MRRLLIGVVVGVMTLSACAAAPTEEPDLPTLAALPSATATNTPTETPTETVTPSETPTPSDTPTPAPTDTPSVTPTETNTPTPTRTSTPTPVTPTRVNPTVAAAGTATAIRIERPVFTTLTPAPPESSGNPPAVATVRPVVVADVIITERQMQEEVNRLRVKYPNIQSAQVEFVDGEGIATVLNARAGTAFATGTVLMRFTLVGEAGSGTRFLQVTIASPDEFEMAGGGLPSDDFVNVAYNDLFPLIGEAFGFILDERLGAGQHDLEFIEIQDGVMGVSLYVPEPAGS